MSAQIILPIKGRIGQRHSQKDTIKCRGDHELTEKCTRRDNKRHLKLRKIKNHNIKKNPKGWLGNNAESEQTKYRHTNKEYLSNFFPF